LHPISEQSRMNTWRNPLIQYENISQLTDPGSPIASFNSAFSAFYQCDLNLSLSVTLRGKLINIIFFKSDILKDSDSEYNTLPFFSFQNMTKFMFKHDISLLTGCERLGILKREQKAKDQFTKQYRFNLKT
jgi:hypothetical protein